MIREKVAFYQTVEGAEQGRRTRADAALVSAVVSESISLLLLDVADHKRMMIVLQLKAIEKRITNTFGLFPLIYGGIGGSDRWVLSHWASVSGLRLVVRV